MFSGQISTPDMSVVDLVSDFQPVHAPDKTSPDSYRETVRQQKPRIVSNKAMKYLYYIVENSIISDPNDSLKDLGIRIFAIPFGDVYVEMKDGDGPYQSIRDLKRNSAIFKRLATKNSKYVQKVLDEKNIRVIKGAIWVPKEKSYSKEFIKIIDHTIRGHVKDKNVLGVHFFDGKKMKLRELINPENEKGVWKARIDFFDINNNSWVEKKQITTFFPRNWSIHQLFHECDYAFNNKIKDDKSKSKYTSYTISGIKVEIIIYNDEVKSMYPLFE
jgi:hypothetical protein